MEADIRIAEGGGDIAARKGVLGRVLGRAADALAIAGGLLFVALIGMSIVSIVGRKLFAMPIQGDIELMQMGAAVGAAAFLPYCQFQDHHIKVDAFTGWLPAGARAALDAVAHLVLTAMAGLLTWRTALQALDTRAAGEVSTLLSVPAWIPVALLVPSFVLLAFCGGYRLVQACVAVAGGRVAQ
jgi:TRAP-type C4-dicarboxylate transport system permease small subunit